MTNRMYERTGRESVQVNCLRVLAEQSTVVSGQAHSVLIRAFFHLSDDPNCLTDKEPRT